MEKMQTVTITLTPDEIAILKMLTEEHRLDDPSEALHVLLQDAISFYKGLWDPSTPDILDQLADEGHQRRLRGETEVFDLDAEGNPF